jgi:hypothetical protein
MMLPGCAPGADSQFSCGILRAPAHPNTLKPLSSLRSDVLDTVEVIGSIPGATTKLEGISSASQLSFFIGCR